MFPFPQDLEHSVRKTDLTLHSSGEFSFKRVYLTLEDRSSPCKGDERVPVHTNRTVEAEEECSEQGGQWKIFLLAGSTMILQLQGTFTVAWPDGRGRPLSVPRTYSIKWDPTQEVPAAGACWSLSGLAGAQKEAEDRFDRKEWPATLEPRF